MADMTLCASATCPVSNRCRRHGDCPEAYPRDQLGQAWAMWGPEKGDECEGFAPVSDGVTKK